MSTHGMHPQRGEVWWVRLDPTVGSEINKTRPCVVVSIDILNERRRTIVIVPISSGTKPQKHLSIPVSCGQVRGVAVIDQVRASAKERFESRAGELRPEQISDIEDGLRRALGL